MDLPLTVEQMLRPGAAAAAAPQHSMPTPEQLQAAEMAVLQQADAVRHLKASGLANSSPEVQKQVQVGGSAFSVHADGNPLVNVRYGSEAAVSRHCIMTVHHASCMCEHRFTSYISVTAN